MAAQTQRPEKMEKYVYRAQAVAAHFIFTNSHPAFGDAFTLTVNSDKPGEHQKNTGRRSGPEISFGDSSVSVSCMQADGVYTTVVRARLTKFNVKNILTADRLEAGMMTVYREKWYSDPARPKQARVLPLPPVIENLAIYGVPLRLDRELELPGPFRYDDARRMKYFEGEEREIAPVPISPAPGPRLSTSQGDIQISADKRRISVPNFGIVYIADWRSWQPPGDTHAPLNSAHWVDLVGLELSNPGKGGGGGLGGDGTSYP